MAALLSGEVAIAEAQAATRQLVGDWNRQLARRDVSMDAEIGDGGFTLAGMIADPSSYVPDGVALIKASPWW